MAEVAEVFGFGAFSGITKQCAEGMKTGGSKEQALPCKGSGRRERGGIVVLPTQGDPVVPTGEAGRGRKMGQPPEKGRGKVALGGRGVHLRRNLKEGGKGKH